MEFSTTSLARLDEAIVARYLRLLRVERKEPSPDSLSELVAAHLTGIPFENVSKFYNRQHFQLEALPGIDLFLDGIERYNFGGTCYSNNFHFYRLLAALGYDVKLCSADMTNPDVHMVIVVTLDGREYLVDAGYGAPFLSPLPRDLRADYVVELGRDRYVLKPQDAEGCSRLELHRDGVAKHGYRMKPAPKRIEDFQNTIANSFRTGATFLNCILLVRFYPRASTLLHNLSLIESTGSESKATSLPDRGCLPSAVERYFGIPAEIVEEVVAELPKMQDAWA
jgi:N-hydroxyarylamine O-acetyltransferase